jgi:hypothetical protein
MIITRTELPGSAFLQRYKEGGAYADCYCMDVPRDIALSDYIAAFYTTPLFRIERFVLGLLAGRPSSDGEAYDLAAARTAHFSAWSVEERANDQLLLRDALWRTRSWLMLSPALDRAGTVRLYFGSAVLPRSRSPGGKASFGFAFHALSGFHRLYTKALMRAAYRKILSH